MATPLSGAAQAALQAALEREHGGIKLHVSTVTALVSYFVVRGEALTELPLNFPLRGTDEFERRWLAKLRAATVADEGDPIDFLLSHWAAPPPSQDPRFSGNLGLRQRFWVSPVHRRRAFLTSGPPQPSAPPPNFPEISSSDPPKKRGAVSVSRHNAKHSKRTTFGRFVSASHQPVEGSAGSTDDQQVCPR